MPKEGQRVQHYRIERTLGAGGMGEVYVAVDERLQRRVALKAIKPEHQVRASERERLLEEARLISKLEHPSICRLYDYLDDGLGHYLVLELIRGKSLQESLRAGDRSRRMRLQWAIEIAEGLVAAHGAGVVHHDLKPANVMIGDDDHAKILDFGVAQLVAEPSAPSAGSDVSGGASDSSVGSNGTASDSGADAIASSNESTPLRAGQGNARRPNSDDDARNSTLTRTAADLQSDEHGLTTDAPIEDPDATFGDDERTQTSGPTRTFLAADKKSVGGTPLYMSPEQARGEATGTASDMFSFGLLLHEMFTGGRAYPLGDRAEFFRRIRIGETDPAKTHNRDLTRLIENLKQVSQSRRPTAVEALRVLRWVQGRRARIVRRTLAATIIGAATLGGIKYTLDVSRQKEIAETRRGQAEQLIEFMLGDLRERLEPVGRLDALSAVGDEALEYFDALSSDELSPEDRERLGRTLTHIGEVKFAEGKLDEARQTYDESRKIYARLVDEQPDEAHLKHGLGGALFGVGRVHWERDEIDEASAAFDEYLELAESAYAVDPSHSENRLELGYALTNVAAVSEALGEEDKAAAGLRRAIEIKRAVVEVEPESFVARESLSTTYEWLARIEEDRGNLQTVVGLREQNLQQWSLFASEDNAQSRWMLAMAYAEHGRVAEDLGDIERARDDYRRDLEIMRELVTLDPSNTIWRRGLVISLQRLAFSNVGGPPRDRIMLAKESLRHCEILLETDPENSDWNRDQLSALNVLARVQVLAGRNGEASRTLERFDSLPKGQDHDAIRSERAAAFLTKGRIEWSRQRQDRARSFWHDGLALLIDDEGASMEVDWQIIELMDLLGRRDEVADRLKKMRDLGFAGPYYEKFYARYALN